MGSALLDIERGMGIEMSVVWESEADCCGVAESKDKPAHGEVPDAS